MIFKAVDLYNPLTKINRITPHLVSPTDTVIIDISYGKMRAANSVQYWQVAVNGLPDMQLVKAKAEYLESLLKGVEDYVDFTETDSHYVFKFVAMEVKLAKPNSAGYSNIEEVFLKPTLVNEYKLTLTLADFHIALSHIIGGLKCRAIGLKLNPSGVILLSGRDDFNNSMEFSLNGTYEGKELDVSFPAKELATLASLIEDKTIELRFSGGSKTRPGSLLCIDSAAGVTVVLSPIHN